MKRHLIHCLISSIIVVALGGFLGTIATEIVLACGDYKYERRFTVTSHGSPPDGTMRDSVRESYQKQLIYERESWYGNKPSVTKGIVGFRDMISSACSFTGWFVGICLGCLYLLFQVMRAIRDWWNARQEVIDNQEFVQWKSTQSPMRP